MHLPMNDGVALIPLRARDRSIRAYAIVDAADADWVNQWRWFVSDGYVKRNDRSDGKQRIIRLHRALLGLGLAQDNPQTVDHIDRDRLNCCRENLRILPKSVNNQNVPSRNGSSSSYRGVSWYRRKSKWQAYVTVNRHIHHLGYFTDELEAAEAAREARLRLLPGAVD